MAFKLKSTTGNGKMYLFQVTNASPGMCRQWAYVTTNTVEAVGASGYIDIDGGDADDQDAIDKLKIGDLIWVYQVASISDTRTIEEDIAGGLTDVGLCAVLINNGSYVDLSGDLLGATVTYSS